MQHLHTKAGKDDRMQSNEDSQAQRQEPEGHLLRAAGGLLVLVILMVWWWNYPYPSGKRPDFMAFLLYWGREAILVLLFGVGLVALGLAALWRAIRRAVFAPMNPDPRD
jgi:hypothetical protein